MISQIFILSARGDILINRDLRSDLIKETTEIFFRKVKLADRDHPPIFNIEGINYIYLERQSIYIVATSRFNVSPSLILEYLSKMINVFKDFCGEISEEAIRKNFVLIYEIIDEMMDYGYPQLTSTDKIKNYIVSPPETSHKSSLLLSAPKIFKSNTIKVTATKESITNAESTNSIFIDVIEKLTVLINSSNNVINSYIDGCIRMKSYLTGDPYLTLNFNQDSNFDDYNFHECVRDTDFNFNRKLEVVPPAGEFMMMNFRLSKDFSLPFKIYPFLKKESPYKVELAIKIKSELEPNVIAKFLVLNFSVPEEVSSVYPELDKGSKNQKVNYNESRRMVEWRVEKFKGEEETQLTTKFSLSKDIGMYQLRKEIGPIKMRFEINVNTSSSLKISKLEIHGTEKENPDKWVRYITSSNSFVVRI